MTSAPINLDTAPWRQTGAGVERAVLHDDGAGATTVLIRFQAGATSPQHRHPAGEDLYVIDGRIRVGADELRAGDFLHAEPGSVHDAQALEPTTLLLWVSEPVEFLA